MKVTNLFAAAAAMTLAGTALAVPPNNPVWTGNGTQIWFAGNNTQYPDIEDAINAASDGDIIMIGAGEYVESITMNNTDVTVVPCINAAGAKDQVELVNPTEGFNNANGYAIRMSGSGNSYVGMYRQFTQLANGQETITVIRSCNSGADYALGADVAIAGVGAGNNMLIESRSIDNIAIYSTDAQGTFEDVDVSTDQGFGGGVIITGDSNTTQFVDCSFTDMIATGNPLKLADGTTGPAVNVITVTGGSPLFAGTAIGNATDPNVAGSDGIVRCTGGTTAFDNCTLFNNTAWASDGMVWCSGADTRVNMSRCDLNSNTARFGTFYWDAAGATEAGGYCNFMRCNFRNNDTANTFGGTNNFPAGGMAWVDGAVAGARPLINFSDCGANDNNGSGAAVFGYQANGNVPFMSVASDWHPYARIAQSFDQTAVNAITDGPVGGSTDVNGDGSTDAADLAELQAALGTCDYDGDLNGTINIEDLLGVIAAYGSTCQ
ncbi:MAG: hypothetical protein MK089_04375 [Phycisphaerales bacterium]|nr:hypothetical protein [Phycisphaerales bacterium]